MHAFIPLKLTTNVHKKISVTLKCYQIIRTIQVHNLS
uniref:Uncharacterized protein n=1 Tax=Arundo donax TaxID=35708 RepID=A0A0A9FUZ3_ARUDO